MTALPKVRNLRNSKVFKGSLEKFVPEEEEEEEEEEEGE